MRLLISAANKSSGKTTVSVGLCAALRAHGKAVQPFKKGPDYIDPMWLSLAAGRACRNLDFNTQEVDEIAGYFAHHASDAGVAVIEGNKGLFDGTDIEGRNATAALAELLHAPVILAMDTQGMTRGIAPLLLGYRTFAPDLTIAGVILNKTAGSRHEGKLRAAVERYTDVPVLGAIGRDRELAIAERHIGLIPTVEIAAAETKIARIRRAVENGVDMGRVMAAAAHAQPLRAAAPVPAPRGGADLRVGIARDAPFSFNYPDDLDALAGAGAEIVPFDTLHDQRLPRVDALFIGGGFPEMQAGRLQANAALRAEIRTAIESGLPCYAECGGAMYLARRLVWQERSYDMVGAIPADAVMHERPVGRGYMRLRETGRAPWSPRDGRGNAAGLPAHEFHHSSLENLEDGTAFAYDIVRGHGMDGRRDGIVKGNLLASYAHMRTVRGNRWAENFVTFVRGRNRPASPGVGISA